MPALGSVLPSTGFTSIADSPKAVARVSINGYGPLWTNKVHGLPVMCRVMEEEIYAPKLPRLWNTRGDERGAGTD